MFYYLQHRYAGVRGFIIQCVAAIPVAKCGLPVLCCAGKQSARRHYVFASRCPYGACYAVL